MTVFQCPKHCLLVDNFTSRCINDNSARFHRPNHILSHKTNCFWFEWHVHAQHIDDLKHLLQILEVFAIIGGVLRPTPVVVHDAHLERTDHLGETNPNAAQSKNTKSASSEIV